MPRAPAARFREAHDTDDLDAYPRAPVIAIVLDNVSTHSSRAVQRWLARHGPGGRQQAR